MTSIYRADRSIAARALRWRVPHGRGWVAAAIWSGPDRVTRMALVGPGGVVVVERLDEPGRVALVGPDEVRGLTGSGRADQARTVAWDLSRRVSGLAGRYVQVRPLLVVSVLTRLRVFDVPVGYDVLRGKQARRWLRRLPRELRPEEIDAMRVRVRAAVAAMAEPCGVRQAGGVAEIL